MRKWLINWRETRHGYEKTAENIAYEAVPVLRGNMACHSPILPISNFVIRVNTSNSSIKIAVCGNYGVRNIGDSAILRGLLRIIKKIWPGSEVTIFGKDKLFPFGIRSFLKAFVAPGLWRVPLRELGSSDVFILGGGGLFTDEEGSGISLFWALQGLTAHFFKKPVLCLGVSIGPIKTFNRWFVRKLFKVAKLVTVRDEVSQRYLEKWGIKSYNTSDLSLFVPYDRTGLLRPAPRRGSRNDTVEKYIVLSVRRFKNSPQNLYKIFAQFCDEIIRKYGLKVRLIPFQDGAENDSLVLNKIFDQIKEKHALTLDPFYQNLDELLDILHNAEVVIAMRLHAGILSLLASTPFIPIDYMAKVGNFWKDLKGIKPVKISEDFDKELLEAFEKMFKNQHFYREKLMKIREKLEGKAKRLVPLLREALKN